jgi:cytochrome P450
MTYFSIFIALVWAYLCYLFVSLLRNYYAAKAVGIPVIISPVDVFHPVWLVFGGLVKPFIFILPYGLRRWSTFYNLDWPFYDKGRIHRDVGEVFALVNPWNIAIILDDPVGAEAVYHRRKDFIKGGNYNLFNFFGKNVFSVNGEDWARQRRITGPCFNENVSGLVWDESTRQARAMLNLWTIGTDSVVNSMLDDTRMITLHVLSGVGFGVRQDFGHGMANVKAGHTLAYRDAIVGLLAHLGEVMVFPRKVLNFPILPKSMKDAGTLLNEFGTYMDEMLNDERQAIEKGEAASRKSNLLSAMIQSSAEERNPKARLTDEEIKGNLFIFNVAGHETTANTLAYAISLLALNQDCQTWLREELKQYTQGQEPRSYEEVFPRLKRCQAIMVC